MEITDQDLRGVDIARVRLRGAEIMDVEISGELRNVVVNGVDVVPLVEAELDRRMPERARMRPTDPDGFREAWAILERLWAETIDRARGLPEAALHERVDGEWSFVETLRHLGFATVSWVHRMVLAERAPWHELDLPWEEAPGWPGVPWDREARPSLDEVLELRERRRTAVREVLASLTAEQLARPVSAQGPGWPPPGEAMPVAECLLILLNEEWHHRLYAERDLARLQTQQGTPTETEPAREPADQEEN